jgi:hypothetical protein
MRGPGVHEFVDEAAVPRLVVLFSLPRKRVEGWPDNTWPSYFDRLLRRGEFGHSLANKFFDHYEVLSGPTKYNAVQYLHVFLDFLDESDPLFSINSLGQISKNIGDEFRKWLGKRVARGSKSQSAIVGTVRVVFRAMEATVMEAAIDSTVGPESEDNEQVTLPYGANFPTPRCDPDRVRPTTVLTDPVISKILKDCRVEIEAAMEMLHLGQAMIDEATPYLAKWPAGPDFRDLPITLAVIERDYGGKMPCFQEIMRTNKNLAYSIQQNGGREKLLKYFGSTPETLVPFALILCFRTLFNSDPLLSLRRSLCFSTHWLWGNLSSEILSGELSDEGQKELRRRCAAGEDVITAKRAVLMTYKGRSASIASRSFRPSDDWDNPAKLLGQLDELTRRWRPLVSQEDADHVFLSVPLRSKRGAAEPPSIFWTMHGPSNDGKWTNSLKNFRKRHRHPHYTLKTIRLTGADLIYEMSGGNVEAARVSLNQKKQSTTKKYYETESNAKRGRDRLAAATGRRIRYVQTNGRSRPDFVAVTPGFACQSPYESPVLGERPGRLCTAFGRCPNCQMACGEIKNPKSVAYMLQLEGRYVDAASKVDMSRYSSIIAPELLALRSEWLPLVSDDVLAKARDILPTLPTMPEID